MNDFDFLISWLAKEAKRERVSVPQVMYRKRKGAC
jgi:hypothetical protein